MGDAVVAVVANPLSGRDIQCTGIHRIRRGAPIHRDNRSHPPFLLLAWS
jgi:hypothetical protein